MIKINYDKLKAYELISEETLGDVKSEGSFLIHKKSGARLALLNNDDENKVFSIAFRTPPVDSTGVPHIMEHSVLCGSRDFPVKDPFVELIKGSLNTFLNAMTYPDKTVYPVASCNDKDFKNLMHVYLDAVFYPNIYKHDEIFRQEGWSYKMDDEDSTLTINGVVYNEMKGVFSSPDDIVAREIFNSLYPDTCYSVESGGDPECIPELTYEMFLDFHKKYYHPCNSFIYLYGNIDYTEVLDWIDKSYLSDFDRIELDSSIALQKPFERIFKKTIEYPVGESEPLDNNSYLTWNVVCGNTTDDRLMQALEILDYALLSAPGAPLELALLDAGIGTDISGALESDCQQPYFSVMAKNANENDEDRFVETIRNTLSEIVNNGMDPKALKAGINYYEFRVREADFGRMPKGLAYGLMMLGDWIYRENEPFKCFNMLDNYSWLRNQIGTGYFEGLIQKYFLDNNHGSLVKAVPSRTLAMDKEQKLLNKLEEAKALMSDEQKAEIIRSSRQLVEYQEAPEREEDLRKIPILTRGDLKREVKAFSVNEIDLFEGHMVCHDYGTNGISYLQLLFEIRDINMSLWPFISLLQNILGVIDTANYTYGDLFNEINLDTGGIGTSLEFFPEIDSTEFKSYFDFKGKALYSNTSVIFEMIREMIVNSKLDDTARIKEIILQGVSQLQAKFMSAGHSTAVGRSMANQGGIALIKELTGGVSYYRFLKYLADNFDEIKGDITEVLKYISVKLFDRKHLLVSLTSESEAVGLTEDLVRSWNIDSNIKCSDSEDIITICNRIVKESHYDRIYGREALYFKSEVNFVSRTGNFKSAGYEYTGAMHALRTILGYEYLWNKVRVTGGAYGCMSSFNRSGEAFFVSYRDPHISRTEQVFIAIPDFLDKFDADERTMTKYIIGAFSDIDQPLSPENLGLRSLTAYLIGLTTDQLQKERDQLLDADCSDIRALADIIRGVLNSGNGCTVGVEDKIKAISEKYDTVESLL